MVDKGRTEEEIHRDNTKQPRPHQQMEALVQSGIARGGEGQRDRMTPNYDCARQRQRIEGRTAELHSICKKNWIRVKFFYCENDPVRCMGAVAMMQMTIRTAGKE